MRITAPTAVAVLVFLKLVCAVQVAPYIRKVIVFDGHTHANDGGNVWLDEAARHAARHNIPFVSGCGDDWSWSGGINGKIVSPCRAHESTCVTVAAPSYSSLCFACVCRDSIVGTLAVTVSAGCQCGFDSEVGLVARGSWRTLLLR